VGSLGAGGGGEKRGGGGGVGTLLSYGRPRKGTRQGMQGGGGGGGVPGYFCIVFDFRQIVRVTVSAWITSTPKDLKIRRGGEVKRD